VAISRADRGGAAGEGPSSPTAEVFTPGMNLELTSRRPHTGAVTVREVYLESAAATTAFLGQRAVAECWDAPSALPRMRVGALTAHLAGQITQVPPVLDAPIEHATASLAEHFARSTWTDGDLDSEVNTYIRRTAEQDARAGPASLTAAAGSGLAALRRRLPEEPGDRLIQLPWGPWALSLDDYLVTRLLELAVHCDDLAASIRVAPPVFPQVCLDTVIGVLCQVAARRHGTGALLRALSRAERAPDSIAAI